MTDLTTPFATRLCLSGAESRRLLDTFKQFGVSHVQLSYYYVQRVFSDPLEFESYIRGFKTVILDSGTIYHRFKTPDEETEFLAEYVQYIAALDKRSITAAVYEKGIKLEQVLPDEAIIYPLDVVRDTFDNDLDALFHNLKYIGISNKEASYKGGENLPPLFTHAARKGALLHAFGTSSKKLLQKYPFYSANTSSWRSGSRYLNTYIYEGPSRGHRLYQPTDKSDLIKTQKETRFIRTRQESLVKVRQPDLYALIDWPAVYDGDSWEVDKANLTQWLLYVRDLELLAQNKYFLTDVQRQDILYRKKELYASSGDSTSRDSRNNTGGSNTAPREQNKQSREQKVSDDIQVTGNTDNMAHIQDSIKRERAEYGTGHTNRGSDRGGSGDGDSSDVDKQTPIEEGEVIEGELVSEGNSLPRETNPNVTIGSTTAYNAGISTDLIVPHKRIKPVDDRMRVLRECDNCILAGRCPKYQPSSKCAYGLPPDDPTYNVEKLDDHIVENYADLLAIQFDRIQQAALVERVDGAGLDRDLGKEIERYATIVQLMNEARDQRDEVSIKAKGHGIMEMFAKKKGTS
jgi:hypothetical protein